MNSISTSESKSSLLPWALEFHSLAQTAPSFVQKDRHVEELAWRSIESNLTTLVRQVVGLIDGTDGLNIQLGLSCQI